ncbi:MAG: AMP-binding protein [Planctomycetota bacterium]
MKVIERFLATAQDYASKVALWDSDRPYTYADLRRAVDVRAHHILISTSRQNVGLLLPTGAEFVVSYFGALLANKTPVPVSAYLSPHELVHVVEDAHLDCILSTGDLASQLDETEASVVLVEKLEPSPTKLRPVDVASAAPHAGLLYTAGSEGKPKGVPLSDLNLLANLAGCRRAIDFNDRFVILGTLPLFHSLALTTTVLLPLLWGATAVYVGKFDPLRVLSAIERRRVTAVVSIPSLYRILLARTADVALPDISTLTYAISGGEPLGEALRTAFADRFGVDLLNGYGLTEASPVVSVNTLKENRPGSVGKPLHNVRVRIVDPDTNDALPPGVPGEIRVEGLSIMEGYHNRPDLTRERFTPDRFFRTGDVGMLDRDGFLHVTGRRSEMMIVSGENVFPQEIEEAIARHEAVLEVAVTGVLDETRGEVPKAFVVLAPGKTASEEEIRQWCRGILHPSKVPRSVEFRPQLPRGPTGKVLRRELKSA